MKSKLRCFYAVAINLLLCSTAFSEEPEVCKIVRDVCDAKDSLMLNTVFSLVYECRANGVVAKESWNSLNVYVFYDIHNWDDKLASYVHLGSLKWPMKISTTNILFFPCEIAAGTSKSRLTGCMDSVIRADPQWDFFDGRLKDDHGTLTIQSDLLDAKVYYSGELILMVEISCTLNSVDSLFGVIPPAVRDEQ